MRIFALSDVHADYRQNMSWLQGLSSTDYVDDTLILAGDISGDRDRFRAALLCLRARFAHIFFAPGNHDLWVRGTNGADSLTKFREILDLCEAIDVRTAPDRVGEADGCGVWIAPLFSWYTKPEEGAGSLFLPKEGEDPTLKMWRDNHFVAWPQLAGNITASEHFLRMNERHIRGLNGAPVISFSHFLPRRELMFSTEGERAARRTPSRDPHPMFNFSRVAGCAGLEEQIRRLNAVVHVYGHQHRNRGRTIDGVRYVSHCLGYPRERDRGHVREVGEGPRLIWDTSADRQECVRE